jgi:hypothetical protein
VITARALGAYVYLKTTGAPVSAESLSKAFPEGRKAFLTVLKELRDLGLITTSRQIVNGKYVTQSYVSDGSPKTALLLQQTQLNTNINNITYSFISKKEYLGEPRGDENMSDYEPSPMYLEPEEKAEYVRKMREKRQAEHRDMKAAEAQERIEAKKALTPADWNSDDSAYHFAEQMALNWHIKPWLTARTRFKAAFGQARKTHGTTGDIELKMMDRFFDRLAHQKNADDPEIIWKMFIKQYSSLLVDVMRATVTDVDVQVAQELADKQWGDLDV